MNRYRAAGVEAEFEPGSRGRVLRNLRGIQSARAMEQAETEALLAAQQQLVRRYPAQHRFTADDVREIHRLWLGGIYAWAGEYRNLNLAKGDFHFAAAAQIPRLMQQFEVEILTTHAPCVARTVEDAARSLAIVHAELVLIHPFREGNGRCARLLSLLMGFQAGLPPLDFGALGGRNKKAYISAIHAALDSNYEPMTRLFRNAVVRTLRLYGGRWPE